MKRYIILGLIIALASLTYLTDFFLKKQRSFDLILRLKQENEELRAEIERSAAFISSGRDAANSAQYLRARVFSNYPFNIKNQITVDAGEDRGITKMMAVTLGENILVGQVKDVFKNSSAVETVFDPGLELPVRIGEKEVDGLLQGGSEPRVILVEKTKPISAGELIYSAGPDFPYGLKIGEVAEIREESAGVFKELLIKAPFNVSELREVNLILR